MSGLWCVVKVLIFGNFF